LGNLCGGKLVRKGGGGGGGDMGETNCEKGKNYCFFHTTTPYTICNLLSL